ncbi:MAG: heparinase II/III family protein [Gemmatimonadales bacterium]|nr:heparinase II/III family protein [Gemmatimonadales bacterium]
MVTIETLEARRALADAGDLAALKARLIERAQPLIDRLPPLPEIKATMSASGGVHPETGEQLEFDPYRPHEHRAFGSGRVASGERHHAHWARAQHLWVAERAAHLATVASFTDDERAADRARELLAHYFDRYHAFPNRDNVLGPSHLFFSTYLESIWVLNYLAAAFILREKGWLSDEEIEAVGAIADEAAQLIGEFDEGGSNRQVWNSAALVAIAVWFGDEELAQSAITGRTGILGHLTDGFGDDGMWTEGENYHLFAVRGLLTGLFWAQVLGADLLEDPRLRAQLGRALMAPAATALPDFTFPARKDSRFGVSLAHPAYLECWEMGLSLLGEDAPEALPAWLATLYRLPHSAALTYDAYLHDAGEPARELTGRADLSWWMLWSMTPTLPAVDPFESTSGLLRQQGVAVLRRGVRYLALECGRFAGGHDHPDRLHLTLHADGIHWLADPGTGSYVTRDLFWYRSTLAHNAPLLDGQSQQTGDARCAAFEDKGEWGWIAAEYRSLRRTVVSGPDWILDLVDLTGSDERDLWLPWHLGGDTRVETSGQWESVDWQHEFVRNPERFVVAHGTDTVVAASQGGRTLRLHLIGGEVVRATAPGLPGQAERVFYLVRGRGASTRLAALVDLSGAVQEVRVGPDRAVVVQPAGATTIRLASGSVTIESPGGGIALAGSVSNPPSAKPLMAQRPLRADGHVIHIDAAPALDGTLDGFETSAPLEMGDEGHYFRSEEPYQDPEQFSATAYVNSDLERLYLAVVVTKPDFLVRGADAPPLDLDNEQDDIHSDGIQVYYRTSTGTAHAYLIRPTESGGILARPIPGSASQLVELTGASERTEDGYVVTVALPCEGLSAAPERATMDFDICVNEMREGRIRRAGQLVWGGGGGWVYLRGDRRAEAFWGLLSLA